MILLAREIKRYVSQIHPSYFLKVGGCKVGFGKGAFAEVCAKSVQTYRSYI